MLLFNPKNGATIRDIWVYDVLYFSSKLEEEFKPGDVIDIDDKVGTYLLELVGFIEQVTPTRAENIVKERSEEKFICEYPKCGFEAKSNIGLISHKRIHGSVVEGVRKIVAQDKEEVAKPKEDSLQKSIEEENTNSGLLGGDLTVS